MSSLHALLINSIGLQNSHILVNFCSNRPPSEYTCSNQEAFEYFNIHIVATTAFGYITWRGPMLDHTKVNSKAIHGWVVSIEVQTTYFHYITSIGAPRWSDYTNELMEYKDARTSLADEDYTWCSCHYCGWSTVWARHPSELCSGLRLHPQLHIAQHPAPTFEEEFRS